jgi:hypothetical protein
MQLVATHYRRWRKCFFLVEQTATECCEKATVKQISVSNAFARSVSTEVIVQANASLKSHEIITRKTSNFRSFSFQSVSETRWRLGEKWSTKNSHYSLARKILRIIYQKSSCEFSYRSIISMLNEFISLNGKKLRWKMKKKR